MRTTKETNTLSSTREHLKRLLKREGMTYVSLARELGIDKAMLWRFVVKGWVPEDVENQRKLGLVSFCPTCRKGRKVAKKKPRVLKATWDVATMIAYVRFLKRSYPEFPDN